MNFVLCGTVAHSISREQPLVIQKAVIVVKAGKIIEVNTSPNADAAQLCTHHGIDAESIKLLKPKQFVMPGLVDTHLHAPQYENVGSGYALELLDWLKTYTYPTESKFSDGSYASTVYDAVVRRTLRNGTTTASYFATIHTNACLVLAEMMHKYGQRGFVGKVNMDQNSPEHYIETTEQSISETRKFITKFNERYGVDGIIRPCITPRFALSCTKTLMKSLGDLAREFNLPIQTHMSENRLEIETVKREFGVTEYVDCYKEAGLLTPCTILAHCVYSPPIELETLHDYNCGISHCPNSNISIRSGLMNAQLVESHRVKLGLGTDISGGYSASILDSLRKSVEVSKILHFTDADNQRNIDHTDSFYFATLGGAAVMGLQDKIGNFMPGKDFDALIIDTSSPNSPFDVFTCSSDELVEKFLYCGDDRNIIEIYIAGRKISL